MKKILLIGTAMVLAAILAMVIWLGQATQTDHHTSVSSLGQPSTHAHMIDSLTNGAKVHFDTIVAADWQVQLSGLLDLAS